ncbi:nuclear transport factor 2 family protein [Micromonospora sp. DT228]|uniref:nuclear transport factor 2 family protein n=1 Tax=Micromonospora sp. DT228 TaxID=3393443 RepID=UPI003CE93855
MTASTTEKTAASNRFIRLLTMGHARFYSAHLERLSEGIDENVVWYTPGNHPLSGRIDGLPGVLEWLRKSAEVTNGTFRAETHKIVADGDTAVVIATWRGERKGMTLEMPGVHVFKIDPETEKVVEARIWVYDDVFVNKFWSA